MNLKKYSWLAALPMIFTACQDDMLVETAQQQGIYTLKATVKDGSASSRAQIVLNGTSTKKESFHWNEGDAFTLFELDGDDSWLKHQFDISESYNEQEPTTSADFSTSSSLTQGREFVAFYPACKEDESGNVQMTIDMTLPDNKKESWTEYFQNNMFMKAKGTVDNTSADTEVNFTQLCGIIRITYKNTSNEDRTLGAIKVDGLWSIGGYCPLNNVDTFVPNVTQKNAYGINFENGATVKAGSSEDFYILFLYNSVEGNSQPMSTVSVSDMDHNVILKTPVYSEELPVFEAGKCYWLNVTDDGEELYWTNDQQGGEDSGDSGTTEEANIDVSNFAELQKALATETTNLYINFLNDIELEGPLSVTCPTTLEMNGYTLSLSDDYEPGDADAVINVNGRLNIYNGKINGKDGSQLHDYYFEMSGTQLGLNLYGVTLETGTAVANAIFMDDDRLSLRSFGKYVDGVRTEVKSGIQASGNAIHYVASKAAPQLWSYINGDIDGNVYVETQYETLNAKIIFQSGTINGNLVANYTGTASVADGVLKANAVTIGSVYTGWDAAGRYVEDQNYSVSTFEELKTAIETAQELDEGTQIELTEDIELTSPLTITKPVAIYGGYSMSYVGNEGAALTVKGSLQKEVYLTLSNTSLIVKGTTTAIYVENAYLRLDGSTNITVNEGGNALHFCASTMVLQPNIVTTGTITGNVAFTANYKDSSYPNVVIFRSGTINGDLITSGTYASDVKVAFEGGSANGEGWADADDNSGDSGSDEKTGYAEVNSYVDLVNALGDSSIEYIEMGCDIALEGPLTIQQNKILVLMDHTLSLSENYSAGSQSSVFEVTADNVEFFLVQGNVEIKRTNGTKLHDYFVKLSGKEVIFKFADIVYSSDASVENVIWMDNDFPMLYVGQRTMSVTTTGNVIYCESNETGVLRGGSYIEIDGAINGDFLFKSATGQLNNEFEIRSGTINGDLIFEGVSDDVNTSDYIKYSTDVKFGTDVTGWGKAGVLTE